MQWEATSEWEEGIVSILLWEVELKICFIKGFLQTTWRVAPCLPLMSRLPSLEVRRSQLLRWFQFAYLPTRESPALDTNDA